MPDQYSDAASILNIYGGRGGSFDIRAQPVFYQLQYGSLGVPYFTEEAALQPGSGAIEPGAIGVRFRNQVAGMAATVDARIAPPGQPLLTLTSAGTVGSTLLTGIVNANGTIAGGSGFTVTRTGAGVYVVAFTTPFSAQPVIVATVLEYAAGNVLAINLSAPAASGFTAQTGFGAAITLQDRNWDFVAQAVQ